MFCFLYKRCFLKLSVIFLYFWVYNILAEENYEKPYLANNKMYLLTWNSLTVQNISPFYDYFYKYDSLLKSEEKIIFLFQKQSGRVLVMVFFIK